MPASYEGLASLGQALKEVDAGLLGELKDTLQEAGDIVKRDAAALLVEKRKHAQKSAAGFQTRVRLGSQTKGILVVAQGLRKTTGKHSKWGSIQVTDALLPARDRNEAQVERILETKTAGLLHRHGF